MTDKIKKYIALSDISNSELDKYGINPESLNNLTEYELNELYNPVNWNYDSNGSYMIYASDIPAIYAEVQTHIENERDEAQQAEREVDQNIINDFSKIADSLHGLEEYAKFNNISIIFI